MTIILTPQSKAFYVRNTMILDSFLRGLQSDTKLDFKCILFTSDRRKRYLYNYKLLKMENSKRPVVGEDCTYKSIDDFKRVVKERLDIDLGKIEFNPGMRQIAKLCLNSLWGKFGQRLNLTQTKYVTEPQEFYGVLLDSSLCTP